MRLHSVGGGGAGGSSGSKDGVDAMHRLVAAEEGERVADAGAGGAAGDGDAEGLRDRALLGRRGGGDRGGGRMDRGGGPCGQREERRLRVLEHLLAGVVEVL